MKRLSRSSIYSLGLALAAVVSLASLPARSQSTAPDSGGESRYEYRASGDPNGLGKFFLGREIAHYMSHRGSPWLDRPERRREERTDLLLENLPVEPGDVVADVGAGSGYFTLPLAERVGSEGRVVAVDIQPEMLAIVERRAADLALENVETVLGSAEDPRLAPASIDLALMVDVYHELSHPYAVISAVAEALKPGGWLVLVEYRGEDAWVPIKRLHKMTEAQVRREMELHPLAFVDNPPILPRQHLLRFRKLAE